MKGLPLYFGKVCSLHPDVISFLICNTLVSVHILRRTTKEPKTRLECYICVDTLIQFSVHGNEHGENWNVFCLPVSSHFVRGQNQHWGWAVSYGQRPAGAANIWQGWGQVLHSFAPPPANTNTAVSSEDPHSWRDHRRFCRGNKSSSFIFCEWRPQILNLITYFLQMSLWWANVLPYKHLVQ